jgi:hypothetical protein
MRLLVDLVWTDVSEECIASIMRVEKSANEGPTWPGGCRCPRADLDDIEKWKFLPTSGLKLRPLGRPARSQSLYLLRYLCSREGAISENSPGSAIVSVCCAVNLCVSSTWLNILTRNSWGIFNYAFNLSFYLLLLSSHALRTHSEWSIYCGVETRC